MLLWILSYLYPNPSPFLVDSGCQETVTGDFEETATGDFEVVLTLRQRRTATGIGKAARRRLVLIPQDKDLLT